MKVPAPITAAERLYVITETVALTIRAGDHPPIRLEVCRLAREPHCLIRPVGPETMTIVRTDEGDEGYAAFDITIDHQTVTP